MRGWILSPSIALLVISIAIGYRIINHYAPPPDIQGAYLQPARTLERFRLTSHRQQTFTREQLKGQWHLVSYGYTHCPDICPMTLARLAEFTQKLEREDIYPDVQVLFYSVDSERDSPGELAHYVPYFHESFVGLTRAPDNRRGHWAFERGLGILAETQPQTDRVGHGVMLFLLNPRAQLQAVLKPEANDHGLPHFTVEQLLQDYRAVRDYYAMRQQ